MKKAVVKPKKAYATFMYIPESESTVKSRRIPSWLPAALLTSFVFMFVLSLSCILIITSSRLQYSRTLKENKALKDINNYQKSEIAKLQQSAQDVQNQLAQNIQVLEAVKKEVGLKDNPAPTAQKLKAVSASTDITTTALPQKRDIEKLPQYPNLTILDTRTLLNDLNQSFNTLQSSVQSQRQDIDLSMVSIKKRLSYLNAMPDIVPVVAAITCNFGYRKNPFTSRSSEFHKGIDFGAAYGTPVHATGDGVVTFAGWQAGYGKMVIISHGYGIMTAYGHNSKLLVKKGDKVKKNQVISNVGSTGRSTGAHLHYEVIVNGQKVNPANYF